MSQIEFLPADKLFTACDIGRFTFDPIAGLDYSDCPVVLVK